MTILKILIGLVSITSLAGCVGSKGSPDYVKQRLAERYVGKDIDAVVVGLGAPESVKQLATGHIAYTWKRTSSKYQSNLFIKSDERCVITMLSDKSGKRIQTIGSVDDSLGGAEISYCAEQYEL